MKQPPYCLFPWFNLWIDTNGSYKPCCPHETFPSSRVPSSLAELMEMFNSKELVRLRKLLASGNIIQTQCLQCELKEYFEVVSDTNGCKTIIYRNNEKLFHIINPDAVYNAFISGETVLNYPPPSLGLQMSKKCNLNCSMCIQKPLNESDLNNFPVDNIISTLKEISPSDIDSIALLGGESFYAEDGINLLKSLGDINFKSIVFITSNGTLLEKHTEILKQLDDVRISISIDGTNEVYNSIRKGSNFELIKRNIRSIKDMKKEFGRPSLSINCTVMKSTLTQIIPMIDFAVSMDLGEDAIYFYLIQGKNYNESIYANPSLLDDDWCTQLDAGIKYSLQKNQNLAAYSLRWVKKSVVHEINRRNHSGTLEFSSSLPHASRIAIYGTGTGGNRFRSLIEKHRKDITVTCFIDSYISNENGDIKIYKIDTLKDHMQDFDYIVIASNFYPQISRTLTEMRIKNWAVFIDDSIYPNQPLETT